MAGKSSDTAVSVIFEQVAKVNSQAQFKNDYKLWPTEQIKEYIPLTFLCCKDQITEKQRDELAMLMQTDKLLTSDYPSSIINYGRVTEDIAEALASVEQNDNSKIILINGAPGIGKSTLLNEIALQWSNKKILLNFKVLLSVSLCNPALCQLKSIKELFEHCCGNDSASIQDIDHCVKYFQQNDGKDLLFTFDGYDELHENLHKDGLICHILNRLELPQCGVIVSSRPHASINFVCETIDILGVSKKHRKGFFKKALSNESQTVSVELLKYLECHSFIYSLCYMPFNIDALVYFAKKLPHSPYHLYENLICLTVSKHIAKHGHEINDGGKITNLREPGKSTVQQLAKLSLNAFSENQYIFKLEDIKQYCPNITSIPGAINGFGLLQAEKHFTGTGMTLTFYFMNYSMQEFLAAYSLTLLSQSDELSFIANKFYDNQFCNVFSIYISLTLGQRPAFKDFFKEHIGRLVRKLSADSKIRNALYKTLHDDCFEDWPLHIKVLIPRIPNEKSRNDTITNDDFDADLRTIIRQWEGFWKVLSIVLDLSNYEISTISKDFALPLCPEQMLRKWMQIEQSPTWGKLEDAIKLTMILLTYVDGSEIRKTYDLNTQYNKKTISASDDMLHEVPKYNILLVVENHMQFKIAICHMEEDEIMKVAIGDRHYFLGTWGQVPVILVEMIRSNGDNESKILTKEALLLMPHIQYVFAIGDCGTFVDKNDGLIVPRVKLCEVVISSHVINQTGSIDLTKSELFRFLKRPENSEIGTKFGKVFSITSPVTDSDAVQTLINLDSEGIAIEMDGVGIAIACQNAIAKVECLVVKGVSDYSDGNKPDTLVLVESTRKAVKYLSKMLNKMFTGATSPPSTVIPDGKLRDDRPELDDPFINVVPQFADTPQSVDLLKALGAILGLKDNEITDIFKSYTCQSTECCKAVLNKWLQSDDHPTWGKLDDAINLLRPPLAESETYELDKEYNKKNISANDDRLHEVHKYNILLVVENHMQFKIAICHMEEAEITKVVIKSRPYFLGTWGQVPVILVQMMESEGENESENFTKKALSSMPHIKYVFAIGVCGTFVDNNDYEIVPRVNLCEVVISSHVINQDDSEDLTKSELFKFLKRPEYSEIDTKFGKIFSTSSPVADSDAVQKLLDKDPEGIAIEMDGVGIAIACKNSNSKVECLVVKGASDFFKRDTLFPVGAGRNAVRYLSRMLNKMLAGKFVEASSPPKNTRWIGNIENASFTHIGGVFHSDHCDVKITIPDGTIIPGFVVELKFAAAHYAPVKFAADELPLSPVVWLSMNGELKKPIEIHMPHYALIQEASQADNIHFAKSSHITNDESEVILTKIQGGKFPVGESYGIIEIKHFCWFSIMKKIDPDKISKDIVMVVVHHKIPKNDIWKCYIGIMSNEEALFEAFKHQFDDDDHNDNNFDNDRPEIIKPLLPIKLVTKENQFNGEANIKHLSNKLQEITKSDADMRGQLENLGERLRGKTYPPCFRLSVHAKQPFFHYNHFFKFCLASTDDQKIIEKDIIIHKAVPIHSPTEFDEEPTLDEFDMIVTNITKDLNWELFAKRLLPINDKDLEELKKSQGYKNGCCNQVFTKWYVTTTTSVRSWHTIIQALKLSGDSKLLGTVETIENIINGTMVKINMKNDGKMIEDGDICTINESQNTKFKCKFIGLQKNIQYTWKHCAEGSDNFTDIEPDDSIKFEKKKAKFLIESLQLTHKGRYQCIATNCHKHTATFHFTLCVKESTTQSAMNNSHGTSPAHAGTDSDEGTSTSTDRSGDGENNYCIVQLDT